MLLASGGGESIMAKSYEPIFNCDEVLVVLD